MATQFTTISSLESIKGEAKSPSFGEHPDVILQPTSGISPCHFVNSEKKISPQYRQVLLFYCQKLATPKAKISFQWSKSKDKNEVLLNQLDNILRIIELIHFVLSLILITFKLQECILIHLNPKDNFWSLHIELGITLDLK